MHNTILIQVIKKKKTKSQIFKKIAHNETMFSSDSKGDDKLEKSTLIIVKLNLSSLLSESKIIFFYPS